MLWRPACAPLSGWQCVSLFVVLWNLCILLFSWCSLCPDVCFVNHILYFLCRKREVTRLWTTIVLFSFLLLTCHWSPEQKWQWCWRTRVLLLSSAMLRTLEQSLLWKKKKRTVEVPVPLKHSEPVVHQQSWCTFRSPTIQRTSCYSRAQILGIWEAKSWMSLGHWSGDVAWSGTILCQLPDSCHFLLLLTCTGFKFVI